MQNSHNVRKKTIVLTFVYYVPELERVDPLSSIGKFPFSFSLHPFLKRRHKPVKELARVGLQVGSKDVGSYFRGGCEGWGRSLGCPEEDARQLPLSGAQPLTTCLSLPAFVSWDIEEASLTRVT